MRFTLIASLITAVLVLGSATGCATTQTGQRQPDSIDCDPGQTTACTQKPKKELESPAQRYMGILETRGGL